MDKPKIVSMKDALDAVESGDRIPELPGELQSPAAPASAVSPSAVEASVPSVEEHPPEVPPERIASLSVEPSNVSLPPRSVEPRTTPSAGPSESPFVSSVPETTPVVASSSAVSVEPEPPVEIKPPTGVPPWVEREPQVPTVAEAAGPVPSYPGVGRPKIQSIQPGSPRPEAASSGKLYDRPELEADRFAEELAAVKDGKNAQADVVKEYREAASRDMLPPPVPLRPLTAEEERARARALAGQIHEQNQQAGFFGKVKRFFGFR